MHYTGEHRQIVSDSLHAMQPWKKLLRATEICALHWFNFLSSLLSIQIDEAYLSGKSEIRCRDGSRTFTRNRINDDFCDCPDGTDEPGASGHLRNACLGHPNAFQFIASHPERLSLNRWLPVVSSTRHVCLSAGKVLLPKRGRRCCSHVFLPSERWHMW